MRLRFFAPRQRRATARRPSVRLHLERLEEREVLDASALGALNYITYSAFQTSQQLQQAQSVTQKDLNQFQHDAASFTAGNGVTSAQINNDLTALSKDVNNIQGLTSLFQRENEFFFLGVMANVGSFSSADSSPLLVDAYFLNNWQAGSTSALQIASSAANVKHPTPPPANTPVTTPTTTTTMPPSKTSSAQLVTLNLKPLDVKLLGLQLQTSPIQVNISAQKGDADLLGNLLGDTANLLNLPSVSNAVNNVLGSTVDLLNSGSLSVSGLTTTSGPIGSGTAATTPVLTLHVAPVTLDLLGAVVTTSPIDLTLTANSGQGQVLGNALTDLANLFNPPLPSNLTIDDINGKLTDLLNELNQQLPGIGGSSAPPPTLSNGQFLNLTVAPINLNLLGLNLQTSQIQVNATNVTGNGDLLGNITTSLLNTLGATPQNLSTLNGDLNAILGKVVGVLNAATLTLPAGAVSSLSPALQELALPNLVNPSGTASAPILNLAIASTSGQAPVNVNLLGLNITTSNIQVQLNAQTGDGQILGNLLYNVASLLNPNGSLNLLPILTALGL